MSTSNGEYKIEVGGEKYYVYFYHLYVEEDYNLCFTNCIIRHNKPLFTASAIAVCNPNDDLKWEIGERTAFKRTVSKVIGYWLAHYHEEYCDSLISYDKQMEKARNVPTLHDFRYALWQAKKSKQEGK